MSRLLAKTFNSAHNHSGNRKEIVFVEGLRLGKISLSFFDQLK